MSKSRSIGLDRRGWTALWIAGALLWSGNLPAQLRDDYKDDNATRDKARDLDPKTPDKDKPREQSTKRGLNRAIRNETVIPILQGTTFTTDQEKALEKWYNQYEFAIMTLYKPEDIALLAEPKTDLFEGRKRLFREQLERATNVKAHDFVVGLAFKYFAKVAQEDYHPAVRYNAMLIVGELNSREVDRAGSDSKPPLPYRPALALMVEEFGKPDQIDAVRLAALIGIVRHIQLDAVIPGNPTSTTDMLPDADVAKVRKLALDLVNTRVPPAGRSQLGHDWMRRRGVEILGWIAHERLDQEIVDTIVARISDSEEERGVRAEAALALNMAKFLPEGNSNKRLGTTKVEIKPRQVAAELVRFVVDVTTKDIAEVDKYITSLEEADEIYGGAGRGGGPGMGGDRMSRKERKAAGAGGTRGGAGRYPGGYSAGAMSARGGSSMYGQAAAADPYSFRIEPVYRKLRYEISCAMKGIRGTDDVRRDTPGGLFKLWPKAAADDASASATQPVNPADPVAADKAYLEKASKALKSLSDKLKVKTEELNTENFTLDKLTEPAPRDKPDDEGPLLRMNKLVKEVIAKAQPKKTDEKDPLKEPDPGAEEPVPVKSTRPAKPKAADPKEETEPAPMEPAAAAPAKPAKPKAAPEPGE